MTTSSNWELSILEAGDWRPFVLWYLGPRPSFSGACLMCIVRAFMGLQHTGRGKPLRISRSLPFAGFSRPLSLSLPAVTQLSQLQHASVLHCLGPHCAAVYIVAPGLWLKYRINIPILSETNLSLRTRLYLRRCLLSRTSFAT